MAYLPNVNHSLPVSESQISSHLIPLTFLGEVYVGLRTIASKAYPLVYVLPFSVFGIRFNSSPSTQPELAKTPDLWLRSIDRNPYDLIGKSYSSN
jgi:hypothetical protein